MSHERFKDMEDTLEHLEITSLLIKSDQDHWLVIHPEEQDKAMRVYRDSKNEITFEWVNAFASQHDPDLQPPSCFDYEQGMFTINYFGIGGLMRVTLTCQPVKWGAGLFNLAPKGLEGLSRQRVVLKEDYLQHKENAPSIAEGWFLGYQVYSDLVRLLPSANNIKVGDKLGSEYYLLSIPQPIQEFLKTGQLYVLVVDDEVWCAGSAINFLLHSYNKIDCRKQNKTTGWKYRDYKAIACINAEGITYPHATREVNLETLLREAKDLDGKPFREVRDAMTFTNFQRIIKQGGLVSLEVKDGIPVLLNSSGQKLQDYSRYSNPGLHQYLYQIGIDVAYYTENPDELIRDAH